MAGSKQRPQNTVSNSNGTNRLLAAFVTDLMLNQSCIDFKLDGLGDDLSRYKPKKLDKCNVWRDPDLNSTANRRRSFPNRMKRFLCELRGEDRLFLASVAQTEERYKLGPKPSRASVKSQVREEYTKPERISRAYKDSLRVMTKGCCLTDQDLAVVRCEKCDYPFEPERRRGPPHPFTPVLTPTFENQNNIKKKSSHAKPSTAYFNLYGVKDTKVQRIKRRRSSTELYKNMVSVA